MSVNAKDVIKQLGFMGVSFDKLGPQAKANLIQHLSNPETKAKISKRAKDWQVPPHDAAMTSAVLFLSKNNLIEDDIAAMLHNRLSENMKKVHEAGRLPSKLGRSLTALLRMQKMREAQNIRRRRAA